MCQKKETEDAEGNTKLLSRGTNTKLLVVLAFMTTLSLMVVPIVSQNRVNVTISQDVIVDVSAQKLSVPFVSTIFPMQTKEGTGVYTITVQTTNYQSTLVNVPIGQYLFVLPDSLTGTNPTIIVSLSRSDVVIDTFIIVATF